ncbi:unnamed protein product [Ophioblennius macclurei]
MDALESLTDAQIGDFLSGRSPLTVSLRVGAHMMYVQLQLSAQDVKKLHQVADSWPPKNPPDSSATDRTPHSQISPVPVDPERPQTSAASVPAVVAAVNCPTPQSLLLSQAPHSLISTPSFPPSRPSASSPRRAATPVRCSGSDSSSPGPPSPAAASTFTEADPAEPSLVPGAIIESFVSHSPGVFSGTFSGTLAPCSQSGTFHPRRGVSIVLQILNDLLRAACSHQGASPALSPHLHPAPNPLLTVSPPTQASNPRTEQLPQSPGDEVPSAEENQMLHCKLERLQHLMHQRRLCRRTRKKVSQTSLPYRHHNHSP